jgi:hypothetical protein
MPNYISKVTAKIFNYFEIQSLECSIQNFIWVKIFKMYPKDLLHNPSTKTRFSNFKFVDNSKKRIKRP